MMNFRWPLVFVAVVSFPALMGCNRARLDAANAALSQASAALKSAETELKQARAVLLKAEARIKELESRPQIELPRVEASQPVSAEPLVVNIARDGKLEVEGKQLGEQQLAKLLAEAGNKNSHQAVLIRSADKVEFRYVARVMDLCRQAGISDYSVAVRNEQ